MLKAGDRPQYTDRNEKVSYCTRCGRADLITVNIVTIKGFRWDKLRKWYLAARL
ncbi:MAG: hypothetical protein LBQ77_06170 [Treponema sp.]|nr:hypothetical protein [Treponema sp.]